MAAAITTTSQQQPSPAKDPSEQWWGLFKDLPQWSGLPLAELTTRIDSLLSQGVSVTERATGWLWEGMTALHFAGQLSHTSWGVELLEFLMQKEGIEELVNLPDVKYGLTPLLHALVNGSHTTEFEGPGAASGAVTEEEEGAEEGADEGAEEEAEEEAGASGGEAVLMAPPTGHRPLLDALNIFLQNGANINYVPLGSKNASRCTALGIAAAKSDVELMLKLIRAGAVVSPGHKKSSSKNMSLNDLDSKSVHPLYTAALHGNIDVVKLLLDHGACVDVGNNQGTVIHAAAYAHSQDLISLFVESGVDINCTDEIGETALFTAVRSYDLPVVRTLLSHGADVNALSRFMGNALAEVCSMNLERGEAKSKLLKVLMEAGCNLDQKGFLGQTALHHAAATGDPDTALLLLQNGADPNILNDSGLRPLHAAFCYHTIDAPHTATIKHLIHHNSEWSHSVGNRNARFICPCEEDCHIRAIHMLYLAGCPVEKIQALARGPPEHRCNRLLVELKGTPLGLQETCRKTIRGLFDYKTVTRRLDDLPVPKVLKDYVMFSDLDYEDENEE